MEMNLETIDIVRLERVLRGVGVMDVPQALMLYIAMTGKSLMDPLLLLKAKGLIEWDHSRLAITNKGAEVFTDIWMRMDDDAPNAAIDGLSEAMWAVWPDIPQPSTGRPSRGSVADVAMRMRMLPPEYGISERSADEVRDACERYLRSLDAGMAYLVTLPDFVYSVKDGVAKSRLSEWLDSGQEPVQRRQELVTL